MSGHKLSADLVGCGTLINTANIIYRAGDNGCIGRCMHVCAWCVVCVCVCVCACVCVCVCECIIIMISDLKIEPEPDNPIDSIDESSRTIGYVVNEVLEEVHIAENHQSGYKFCEVHNLLETPW